MYSIRRGTRVNVNAPAKLNLFLELIRRRPDGFHELETVMVPINLYDSISVTPRRESRIQLMCDWVPGLRTSAGDDMPETTQNIAYKAATLLQDSAGVKTGADIQIAKRIPSRAGMGGGSSDAAATLVALNIAWDLHWSAERLAELGAQLGSDVPFFLYETLARCTGRGELIHAEPMKGQLNFVIVKPEIGLSTPAVFREATVAESPGRCASLLDALATANTNEISRLMFNRLQSAASKLTPWIETISRRMDELSVCGHQMSGSGTSYFALCRNKRHAGHVAAKLRATRLGRTIVATTIGPNLAR